MPSLTLTAFAVLAVAAGAERPEVLTSPAGTQILLIHYKRAP